MGATKRLAEMICQGLQESAVDTTMIVVRFGNVLEALEASYRSFRNRLRAAAP